VDEFGGLRQVVENRILKGKQHNLYIVLLLCLRNVFKAVTGIVLKYYYSLGGLKIILA
jgi:hypothetical protein